MASRLAKGRSAKHLSFRLRKIAGDGRCFWYSWISTALFDEWWSVDRNVSGYASQRVRQKTEEGMGQALLEEVIGNLISTAQTSSQTDLFQNVLDRQGWGHHRTIPVEIQPKWTIKHVVFNLGPAIVPGFLGIIVAGGPP